MAATSEIQGLFSKEHAVLVLMIIGNFFYTHYRTSDYEAINSNLVNINSQLVLINYRLDNEKLVKTNITRSERSAELQKADSTGVSNRNYYMCMLPVAN